jgi:palmitoyl-protein thioesterase
VLLLLLSCLTHQSQLKHPLWLELWEYDERLHHRHISPPRLHATPPPKMRLLTLSALLPLITAYPSPAPASSKPLPLLIWHGLGDRYDAEGLHSVGELAAKIHPGAEVYYIRVSDSGSDDQRATFFGNITSQSEEICSSLASNANLTNADGVVRADALGFSQGGQFLRGLVERCPALSVRSLVTYGSQHNGIAQFQRCGTWDLLCKGAVALVGGNAWTDYVQRTVVPAQYYRELNESTGLPSDGYLEHSHFLADVNNEREEKNEEYAARLAALEKFVMVVFEDDKTVVPKESGWFAEVNETSGVVTDLRQRAIYKEDWIGLRALDEKGGLVFESVEGEHMELDQKDLERTFGKYFGAERKLGGKATDDDVGGSGQQQVMALRKDW